MKYIKATTVPQEIHSWFQGELESRGIDTVYSHTVMSLLLHPDQEFGNRGAAVECLKSATEQKFGIEALVDELCRRLNSHLNPESHGEAAAAQAAAAPPVEEPVKRKSPKELAQMYYAAFPALENSRQVQAQRVSWDGRRIIELHEREQQHAESVNWELLQEQQLRSKLDSPSLVAIWGRQASTAIGGSPYPNVKQTHIFDFFNSVWALSGEDKVMLKVQDKMAAKEVLHGSGASSNTQPLGAAVAKVIAMLVKKHNCPTGVFRDETLFWNWVKSVSDDPLLQAVSNAGPAVFREARRLMRKAGLLYAGQGDCLPTDLVPGEMAIKPICGSNDLLAMGDVTAEPAKHGGGPWSGGFNPTRQPDHLDFEQEGIVSAEERLAKGSVFWPCTSSSLPSSNSKEGANADVSQFDAFNKQGNQAGTWHPTWLEDYIRQCPDAEVPPIFMKIQNQAKASSSGTYSSPSKNQCRGPSLQTGHLAGLDSSLPPVQVDCAAAEWSWKVGSDGELTTTGPLSPIQLGNKVFPEINSSNFEELQSELEAELDIILNNLYELSQPWDTLLATCDASQNTLHPEAPHPKHPNGCLPRGTVPNTRLLNAKTQAAFTTASNQQQQLLGQKPTDFMPNMHARLEELGQNMSELDANLGAPTYGQSKSNQCIPRYSEPSNTGASVHSSPISINTATGDCVSLDARPNVGLPSAEQIATFSRTPGRSRPRTANQSIGNSEASHNNFTWTYPANCNAEATTYMNSPTNFVPDSNAVKKVKQSSLATSSLQHMPMYATNLPSAGCSAVSTMDTVHTMPSAGIKKNYMPQSHASQPHTSYGFPQKILLPNRSLASSASSDASISEALTKANFFQSALHSNVTNDSSLPEPSLTGPLPAGTGTLPKSMPDLLPSTNPTASTSMPGNPVCATTASGPLMHDAALTAMIPNHSAALPTLSASGGNLNFGKNPWTLPQLPSQFSHETVPRPPAWHQHGHTPWTTQDARTGSANCPLPGHVAPVRVPQPAANQPPACTLVSPHLNCSVAVHAPPVRASPPSAHRPSASSLVSPQVKGSLTGYAAAVRAPPPSVNRSRALANPQIRLGPGPLPRQPLHASWPSHPRWPLSSWPPLVPENRNPKEPASRPLMRHGSALSPATWPPLRPGPAVVHQSTTQPTSVCGIIPSLSFGQVAKLPAHRPAATLTAGTNTPQTPVADSLLGPRPRLPSPASLGSMPSACSQPSVRPCLTSGATSIISATSTTMSPAVPSQPTGVHTTSNAVAPVSRYSGVPAPRHVNKMAQGRCFKAPGAPGTRAPPVPRLPPRLAPRHAARLAARLPVTPSSVSSSNSSKLNPGADKPVNKDNPQIASAAANQQPATGDPKECDTKVQTATEDSEKSTNEECSGSPSIFPSIDPSSAWRKAPNIKGLAGASARNSQDGTSKQNETAPAPPEKNRQETTAVSTAPPPPTSGRRKKRR